MAVSELEQYLGRFEGEVRGRLELMRTIVKQVSPDAQEGISYGLIGYKLHSKPLVYFGGFKNHVGLYATPNGHEAFAKEFSKYKQGKGSVQFPNTQPLPVDLIKRVVIFRNHQIDS